MNGLKDKIDAATIGLEMGGCVAVGYLIGSWVDGKFATSPWGMYFFLAAGIGAAAKGLMRTYRQAKREMTKPLEPGLRTLSTNPAHYGDRSSR